MNLYEIPTPSYVIDEAKLVKNLKLLKSVQEESGCKILLAQKAFSAYHYYPLIGEYLCGTTASGLYEARLGWEEMHRENHIFSPAYREEEIEEIAEICDHVIFNSFSQVERYAKRIKEKTSIGLRLNPECSTQEGHAIYDPCAPGSRLGVTLSNFQKAVREKPQLLQLLDGFHMHTLCEQNADDFAVTVAALEEKFGDYLKNARWINLGGGHHITRSDYDRKKLAEILRHLKETYHAEIYLEPGEAIALNAGYLVTEVMDIVSNGSKVLILDASAACHMPDVLEMPYRPPLKGSGARGEKAYEYRLSSCTCLAGDVIGDYSFDHEIEIGEKLVFEDMAIYSMVKNNTFNGMALPSIYGQNENGECHLIKKFDYSDFKTRLS